MLPLTGVIADRLNRKHLLIASDLARALIVMGYLVAMATGSLALVYALVIAQSALMALFDPAKSALLPGVVPPQDLVRANTLESITWSAMLALGAMAGGLVAGAFGTTTALLFDAATFVISALLISGITLTQAVHRAPATTGGGQGRGFRAGLRYARGRPGILTTLFVKAGSAFASTETLLTVVASALFVQAGVNQEARLGLLYAMVGIGAVAGPLLFNRWNTGTIHRMRWLILLGFLIEVAGWLLLGASTALLLVGVAFLVRSMGSSVNWTYSSVILQKSTEPEYLGRVFSLDFLVFQAMAATGTLFTGLLIDGLGPERFTTIALIFAVLAVLPVLAWGMVLRRQSV
jgi:MFS family permease